MCDYFGSEKCSQLLGMPDAVMALTGKICGDDGQSKSDRNGWKVGDIRSFWPKNWNRRCLGEVSGYEVLPEECTRKLVNF